nr:hypothetical protein Iba_chr05dCG8250 [Ipomoea batatas]GME09949.1 hypothetical protein Iba_scaffold9224CG0190 [Ipomoea batatas]
MRRGRGRQSEPSPPLATVTAITTAVPACQGEAEPKITILPPMLARPEAVPTVRCLLAWSPALPEVESRSSEPRIQLRRYRRLHPLGAVMHSLSAAY